MSNRSIARVAHLVVLALALALVVLVPRAARAATTISGGNVINQTWTPAGSPYIVQGDVTVPNGASLTIQAGTVVQMAGTDSQLAGLDTNRVEITIKGTLNVNGTAASPVQFAAQSGSGASLWYGIVIDATATAATINNASIKNTNTGIRSDGTGMTLAVADTTIDTTSNGVYLLAGTPTLTNLTVLNSSYAAYVSGTASPTFSGCTFRGHTTAGLYVTTSGATTTTSVTNCGIASNGAGSYGVYQYVSGGGNGTLNLTNVTLHNNGSYGVYASSNTGAVSSVNVKNSNVTNHSTAGVYRAGSGTTNLSTTYSNVWANATNFSGASAGTGCFSSNPLYVGAPNNLRLTSNSPSRYQGDAGQDLGPLPYVNDATPGLYGVLWTNTTLTTAGSPYTIAGDLTVGKNVTVTIDAGVTLQFSSGSDIMGSGLDTNRGELVVKGTLASNGTAASPVTLKATTSGASNWYGVVVDQAATAATLTYTNIQSTNTGLRSEAAGNALSTTGVSIDTTSNGVYLLAGTPTLTNTTVLNSSYAAYVSGTASPTFDGCTFRGHTTAGLYVTTSGATTTTSVTNCGIASNGAGSYGVYQYVSGGGNGTLNLTNVTLHNNGSYGVYASSNTGAVSSVNVKNSNVTNHSTAGVYRAGSGTTNLSTTYSNVWANATNFSGASAGTGCLSSNPLYVGAPNNLRLTSNSPSRYQGDAGQDLGPLPYVNDATPGLYGVLWTNTTLTTAGSPYTIAGDLTVGKNVTVTIDAGVTLQFAAGSDIMGSGLDTNRGELVVKGTLASNGTAASPVTLKATTSGASNWYGVVVEQAATAATLTYTNIQSTNTGLRSDAPGTVLSSNKVSIDTTSNGVYLLAGTPTLTSTTVLNSSYAAYVSGTASPTFDGCLFRGHTTAGLYVTTSGATTTTTVRNCAISSNGAGSYGLYQYVSGGGNGTLNLTNASVHGNGSYGVYASSNTGAVSTVNVKNSIVTGHSTAGIYRAGSGTTNVSTTYSDVWNNATNYSGASAGTGCISQNPNYVSAPSDLHLSMGSVCIDAGTAMGAPANDLEGKIRPLDGDGINGAAHDMGAYEYAPAFFCGDGVTNGGELCDDGAQNGQYGACKADCTGPGPRCGDGMVNGPEMCDDANASNTDGCLTTCVPASCGDGYVQMGVEMCDDGNMSDTDGCVMGCKVASCGDGFVQAGVEQCDDGNMSNTDGCIMGCKAASCGDGYVQAGVEMCDDGNMSSTDGCVAGCKPASCGDGFVQAGVEMCDDGNMSDTDGCLASCKPASCGDGFVQAGVEQCDDGNMSNTDGCLASCKPASCGDGFVQAGVEECDDGNMVNSDQCPSTCKNATCGDGVVQAGVEECDDGNLTNGDACLNACKNATCGDGVVQAGVEQCDDGNASNTDTCVTDCKTAACGDGYVQGGVEACDDGNQNDTDGCKNNCSLPGCGDGIVGPNEECDDGNASSTDACLVTCKNATCGDGFVRAGVEACDDGNTDDTDACPTTCKDATCGDGFVLDGVEECDDENSSNSDDCVQGCKAATCGDGYVELGVETCDDGNENNDDTCSNLCTSATCGDGVVQPGEACDDGNASNFDECLSGCLKASCGDGFVWGGMEECDDANGVSGDGCTFDCKLEGQGGAGGGGGAGGDGGAGGGGMGGAGGEG
ncbi:DUF4215 domain-containing protein, partial [Polyangium sp. 6x1]|uniref:DUF4215 domain-containing protein n=1 Tax=Polyangium sp. 6x1 TaxID=3042689 RepID=UPI0024823A07